MKMKVKMTSAQAAANGKVAMGLIGIGLLIVVAMSSISYLLFIAIALVPAIAALLLDRPGQRQATTSVAAMTLATVIPLVLGAIASGSVRNLLGSSVAWTFVGAAAGTGFALYFLMPAASSWMADMRASARLRAIRERQQALEKDWGPEVVRR